MQVFAAKAVCFGCAVRAACLSFALATGQAGIWGGTTQEERRAMRRPSGFPAREHRASLGSAATHTAAIPPDSDLCTPTGTIQADGVPTPIIACVAATACGTRAGRAGEP